MKEKEYFAVLNHLLEYLKLVPEEYIKDKLDEANKILGRIDADDVVFLATAMSIENARIWSDDSDFNNQNKIKVFKTKELAGLF